MVFPGHTHLHFGHSLLISIKINQLFCISCLTVCQCTQTVNNFTTIVGIAVASHASNVILVSRSS